MSEFPSLGYVALDEVIFAAIAEEIHAVGISGASAQSIADRAGISRVTLYRRAGTIGRLLLTATTQELDHILQDVSESSEGNGLDKAVNVVIGVVQECAKSPLLQGIIEHDPELLTPYMTNQVGQAHLLATATLAGLLEEGVQDGSIRKVDVLTTTSLLIIMATSFVMGMNIVKSLGREDEIHAAFAESVRRTLAADPHYFYPTK